ncbi:MAG TPA: GtrA family protein [Candidatus Dormibacteraeota bacterium]|nr:GtrA family protein [Candidatus Dormibacteraeota bacterium]
MKLIKIELMSYFAVSLLALFVDVLSLYLLVGAGHLARPTAAVIAYLVGLIVHYLLAVTFVFAYRRFGRHQGVEFAGYLITGLIGVGTNYAVMFAGAEMGAALWESKTLAVLLSFGLTYVARRWWLFAPHPAPPEPVRE